MTDLSSTPSSTVEEVATLLGEVLSLTAAVKGTLVEDTELFGNLPELDSMAVATVLTALEDRFDILIDDDEISGDLFETVGSLAAFVDSKRQGAK